MEYAKRNLGTARLWMETERKIIVYNKIFFIFLIIGEIYELVTNHSFSFILLYRIHNQIKVVFLFYFIFFSCVNGVGALKLKEAGAIKVRTKVILK